MRGITRDDMPGNSTDHVPEKPASLNQRFLILTRNETPAARRLMVALSSLGQAEIILDVPMEREDGIYYPDEAMDGYHGLMGNSASFPPITAWSRALYHLSKTLSPDEAVWFVEDDVAGHPAFFESLAKTTAASNPDLATMLIHSKDNDGAWPNWHFAAPWFDDPVRAFGPLCRLSARLIARVLEFRETHGRFTFHEVLFPSLATLHGMRLLDWNTDPLCRHLFGTFRFRPVVDVSQTGINHPVKDGCLHEAICDLEPEDTGWSFPRMEDIPFQESSTTAGGTGNPRLDIVMAALATPRQQPLLEIFRRTFQDDFPLDIVEGPDSGSGNGDFMTESWYDAVRLKTRATLEKLTEHRGKILIFSDIDIQFFKPVRPIVESIFNDPHVAIALQAEGYPVSSRGYNTGFIAFRCDDPVIALYTDMCQADLGNHAGDQSWLNTNLGKYELEVAVFPTQIWCWSQSPNHPPHDIILHHANCTVGANALSLKLRQIEIVREIVEARFPASKS